MANTVKIKFAVDGLPSKGRPFVGTVTEETETHVSCTTTEKLGPMKFSKKTGLARANERQYILDGYPKQEPAAEKAPRARKEKAA